MKLNLHQLHVFQAVAEAGGIRAAARLLGLTQPAVTYIVRELERTVGAALLQRTRGGIELTAMGSALHQRAILLLSEMRRTEDELAQLRDGTGGSLCIAFSSGAAIRVLVPTLNRFRQLRQGVSIELHEITLLDAKMQWRSARYDFAVISELDEPPADDLDRKVLFTSPMIVTARKGHPLAGARTLRDLRSCPWVMPSYGSRIIGTAMEHAGAAAPDDILLCQSLQFSLSILRGTNALTLYSSALHDDPLVSEGLIGIRVQEALPRMRVSLVVRNLACLTPAAHLFIRCLREASVRSQ